MNRESIQAVLRDVFDINDSRVIGEWVSFRCFLSPWSHEKGADRNPSAGILISDHSTSIHNCFVCGNKVPLHVALERYAQYSGENLGTLIDEIKDEEYLGPLDMPEWGASTGIVKSPQMPINDFLYLDLYPSAAGHPYLLGRGISRATANRLELRFDSRDPNDGSPRILFPVRGRDGLLYGFSGRDVLGTAVLKVRDYYGLKKAQNLLGAHLAADAPHILAVEGLFDYARAHECGHAGCAIMQAHPTEDQVRIFRAIGKPVYLFLDNDQAGQEGAKQLGQALRRYVPTMKVRYPRVEIVTDDKSHLLKDPGEMIAEEFDSMIADARMFL